MAKFDPDKDKLVVEIGRQKKLSEDGKVFIAARVYQYDGGNQKLALERIRLNKEGGEVRLRLGRISMDEALWIQRAIARWKDILMAPDMAPKKNVKKKARRKKVKKAKSTKTKPKTKVVAEHPLKQKPVKVRRKKKPVKKVKP